MSKPLSSRTEVPADVETVYRTLTSAAWPEALDARLKDGSTLVSSDDLPDGRHRTVQRRRLPDGIPSFLLKFAPKDGTVTQTDLWDPAGADGVRTGTWEVSFPGSPGEIKGTTRVEPAGSGSVWLVTGHVKVSIPLVGGKAEGFLAPLVEKLVGKQGEVLVGLV